MVKLDTHKCVKGGPKPPFSFWVLTLKLPNLPVLPIVSRIYRSYTKEFSLAQSSLTYEQYEVEPEHLFYSAHLSALETLRVDLHQLPTEVASQLM
jgi:hypothetical protein